MNSELIPPSASSGTGIAFLLGIPRSGTTVLSLLLNQHPEIFCPPEPWLLLAMETLGEAPGDHPADAALLAQATGQFLGDDRAGIIADMVYAASRRKLKAVGKSLLVDKTPRYYQCLDSMTAMFPDAPSIWLVRNPLDVAASYLNSWDVDLAAIIDAKVDSPFFADYVYGLRRLADFSKERNLCLIRYETLLSDLNREMTRVTAHLGMAPFEFSETLEPRASGYSETAFGDKKILETSRLHRRSVGSYGQVLSRRQIAILLGALGPDLWERLGYGKEYRQALEFVGGTVDDRSESLYLRACHWLEKRRIRCGNAYENAQLTAARLRALEEENRRMTERWRAVENNQPAALLRKLAGHYRRRIRETIDRALWLLARGRPPRPLPSLTIVTPVLNGAAHVAEAVGSVLAQDYPSLEYIIVDGGSTDGTLEIVEDVRSSIRHSHSVKVLSEPDQGLYDALAKGFALASGEILGWLNADDLLELGRLCAVGRHFAEHPRDAVIYHEDIVVVDGWKFPNREQPEGIGTADLLNRHMLFQDAVFFRRRAYEAVGGLDRDFRLAGDFDLWLRLSARFRFVRQPGHVSCFRIRTGQLSTDMAAYDQERDRSVAAFRATVPAWRFAGWSLRGRWRKRWRDWRVRIMGPRSWRYFRKPDIDPPLPPGASPGAGSAPAPHSPVDGQAAERLLFSSMDTRFGDRGIHSFYLDERHRIAICHPPMSPEALDVLYRQNYSGNSQETSGSVVDPASPYRNYRGGGLAARILFRIPAEELIEFRNRLRRLRRRWRRIWAREAVAVEDDQVPNPVIERSLSMLRRAGFSASAPVRLLDVGCFEGELLDRLKQDTAWRTFGLEPNGNAAAVARAKGHQVWETKVENALEQIPEDHRFEVIHLGQCLEHMEDPLRVLRLLKMLLAPGGALVLSTPNLDSVQIDWFGPTWAHWHPPYHRHVFSVAGLRALAFQASLRVVRCRSHSHHYWTMMSILLNRLGVAGAVSHELRPDLDLYRRAQRLTLWSRMFWDWRGRGDDLHVILKDFDD